MYFGRCALHVHERSDARCVHGFSTRAEEWIVFRRVLPIAEVLRRDSFNLATNVFSLRRLESSASPRLHAYPSRPCAHTSKRPTDRRNRKRANHFWCHGLGGRYAGRLAIRIAWQECCVRLFAKPWYTSRAYVVDILQILRISHSERLLKISFWS